MEVESWKFKLARVTYIIVYELYANFLSMLIYCIVLFLNIEHDIKKVLSR